MSETPQSIQQQIAELEADLQQATRPALKRAIERELADLSARLPTPPHVSQDIQAGSNVSHVQQTHQEGDNVQGTAEVSNAQVKGPVTGINYGTIQAFFGGQPPPDSNDLLAAYLDSLIQQYSRLRLGKLLPKDQSGREEATAPALALRDVYTSLTTDYWLPVKDGRFDGQGRDDLLKSMQKHDPAEVMPEQVRLPLLQQPDDSLPEHHRDLQWASVLRTLRQQDETLRLAGHWYQPELAVRAISTHARLVLLGAPGSGKSTVLRYLTVWLAEQLLAGTQQSLPLFCQLGRVAKTFDTNPAHDLPRLLDALLAPVEGMGLRKELRSSILTAWRKGGVLLCLDGLDEVSSIPVESSEGTCSQRERMADTIRKLAENLGTSRIVVTCRIKPYEQDAAWQLREPWQVRTLQSFSFGQVRRFIPAWYQQTCTSPQAKFTQDEAKERAERLIAALAQRATLHDLTRSPLLLTMLALLDYNNKQLPEKRVDVYEELVDLLLDRWAEVRSADKPRQVVAIGERLALPGLQASDLRPLLYDIAFLAHQQAIDGRGVLEATLVNARLDSFFERKIDQRISGARRRTEYTWRSAEFLHLLSEETGLLQDEGDGQYVLPHLSFEEYLAACHLEYREDAQLAYQQWQAAADRWREVLLLLMGRLVRQNKFAMIALWLNQLLAQRCGKVEKARLQSQRDGLFAAICYAEIGRRTYLEDRLDVLDLEQRMAFALVDVLEQPAAELQTAERIEAGFLLGDLGDPRIPVTVEEWQRELARIETDDTNGYFCKVQAGTYLIGSRADDPDADEDEKPQHRVTFEQPFWIARFSITNAQWQAWVQQGGTRSYAADDTDLNRPNQPVVAVSWHMCNAFCAWLNEQIGMHVRLPTEAEWEAAARGPAGRRYPWGDTWQEDCAETAEDKDTRGWRWSVPVGCYPHGAAGCGARDMAGNVWEWSADVWRSHPGAKEPFEDKNMRVQKGGYYGGSRTGVRCAARDRYDPDGDYGHDGFRLVLSP